MTNRSDRILFRIMIVVVALAGALLVRSYLNGPDDPNDRTVEVAVSGVTQTTQGALVAGEVGAAAVANEPTPLSIDFPPNNSEVTVDRPQLSGTSRPRARIQVGDRATIADDNGDWEATTSLREGINVVAVQDETNGEYLEWTINYSPPTTAATIAVAAETTTTAPTTTAPITTTTAAREIVSTPRPTTTTTIATTTTRAPTTTEPATTTASVRETTTTTAPATTTTKAPVKPTTTTAPPRTTTTKAPAKTTTTTAPPRTTTTVAPRTTTTKAPTGVRECSRLNPQDCQD